MDVKQLFYLTNHYANAAALFDEDIDGNKKLFKNSWLRVIEFTYETSNRLKMRKRDTCDPSILEIADGIFSKINGPFTEGVTFLGMAPSDFVPLLFIICLKLKETKQST